MRSDSTCRDRRGDRRSLLHAGWLLAAAGAVLTAAPQSPPPVFRAATDLVVLQVSVVDSEHRFVSDLGVGDFAVYEEGERQNVATFVSTTAPLDVVILLDTSASMGATLKIAQRAAMQLVDSLKDEDRGALIVFNDNVQVKQALTRDTRSLESAIRGVTARGTTALYDAIYIAQHELARARQSTDPRRQAIVVLSDGDDTRSRLSFDDVLDEAKRSAVTVFTITTALVPGVTPVGVDQQIRFDMRQLAEVTGGRTFAAVGIADLERVYDEIAVELGQQYWLGYVRPNAEQDGFRRVSVAVETREGLRARTRSGYQVSTPRRAGSSSRTGTSD
jgi:Ca-activated chloride channel family protein